MRLTNWRFTVPIQQFHAEQKYVKRKRQVRYTFNFFLITHITRILMHNTYPTTLTW